MAVLQVEAALAGGDGFESATVVVQLGHGHLAIFKGVGVIKNKSLRPL